MGEAKRRRTLGGGGGSDQRKKEIPPDIGIHIFDKGLNNGEKVIFINCAAIAIRRMTDDGCEVCFGIKMGESVDNDNYCGVVYTKQSERELLDIMQRSRKVAGGKPMIKAEGRIDAEVRTLPTGFRYRRIIGQVCEDEATDEARPHDDESHSTATPKQPHPLPPDVLEQVESRTLALFHNDPRPITLGSNPPTDPLVRKVAANVLGLDDLDDYEPYDPAARQVSISRDGLTVDITEPVHQLIALGQAGGFLGTNKAAARHIGEEIDRLGGFDVMLAVYRRVRQIMWNDPRHGELEVAWNNIGQWQW